MNNSDMPAMPSDKLYRGEDGGTVRKMSTGLTKREHFAGLIMSSIAFEASDKCRPNHFDHTAMIAVQMADALLLELDK